MWPFRKSPPPPPTREEAQAQIHELLAGMTLPEATSTLTNLLVLTLIEHRIWPDTPEFDDFVSFAGMQMREQARRVMHQIKEAGILEDDEEPEVVRH